MDQFVIWTGQPHRGVETSRIAQCVAVMQSEGPFRPVALRSLFQKVAASHAAPNPDEFKTALRLHQRSRAPTLLLARKGADGKFRAVYDISASTGFSQGLCAGDAIEAGAFARTGDKI
jgi:hypothetical protein